MEYLLIISTSDAMYIREIIFFFGYFLTGKPGNLLQKLKKRQTFLVIIEKYRENETTYNAHDQSPLFSRNLFTTPKCCTP